MKKILETLRAKWAEFLLEILVIVVGILVAFILDSWNQKIAMKRQLTDSMVKLLEDLKKDSLLLNVQFEVFHNFANNGELIKELLTNQNSYEDINTNQINKIQDRVDQLANFPEFQINNYRELIEGNYRILYRILSDHVDILRIHHSSREIK